MSGVIYYGPQSELGTVDGNTEEGIFGVAGEALKNRIQAEALPIGYRQDVHPGKAVVRTSVSGEAKDYEIEIFKGGLLHFSQKQRNGYQSNRSPAFWP